MQSQSILVSVCILAYNHEKYIAQAIESVLIQKTNFKYEILIGEDYSHDNTPYILKKYMDRYPDIIEVTFQDPSKKIYINGKPTGRYNFISLVSKCSGKYIAILDGDDYWTDPYKLQKQVDFLEANPDFSICFHQVQLLIDRTGELIDDFLTKEVPAVTTIDDLAHKNYIHTPSVVFRNGIEIPEWFNQVPIGDFPLYILLAQQGKIYKMPDVMAVYRIHEKGIIQSRLKDDMSKKSEIQISYAKMYHHLYKHTGLLIFKRCFIGSLVTLRLYYLLQKKYVYAIKTSLKIMGNLKNIFTIRQFCVSVFCVFFPFIMHYIYASRKRLIHHKRIL